MSINRSDPDAGRVDLGDVTDPEGMGTAPIHPGLILRDEWLILRDEWIVPLGLSVYSMARELGMERSRLNDIVLGRRAITADAALRLARCLGTDAQSWMNLQSQHDLETARAKLGSHLDAEVRPRAA